MPLGFHWKPRCLCLHFDKCDSTWIRSANIHLVIVNIFVSTHRNLLRSLVVFLWMGGWMGNLSRFLRIGGHRLLLENAYKQLINQSHSHEYQTFSSMIFSDLKIFQSQWLFGYQTTIWIAASLKRFSNSTDANEVRLKKIPIKKFFGKLTKSGNFFMAKQPNINFCETPRKVKREIQKVQILWSFFSKFWSQKIQI